METLKTVAEVVLEHVLIVSKWVLVKVKSVDWQGLLESVKLSLVNLKEWVKDRFKE
jgi:hypothetical protein